MTGRIIHLHGDLHDETAALLPWYVTDRLDAEDRARVEAHLTGCTQCQAALATERSLQSAIAGIAEDETGDVDAGWESLRFRLDTRPGRTRVLPSFAQMGRQWQASAPWMQWAVAAQLTLLVAAGGLLAMQANRPTALPTAATPAYHALSAAPASAAGNVVVIFRPDIRESELRQTLRDSHARLVDGPTAADAYILQVPAAGRDQAVAQLRGQRTIVLAEPVDAPNDALGAGSGGAP